MNLRALGVLRRAMIARCVCALGLSLWLAACGGRSASVRGPDPESTRLGPAPAPPAAIRTRLRIATFNLQVFGPAKAGRPEVLNLLAELFRRYDLVAVQEIRDVSERAPHALLAAVNANDRAPAYAMALSPRTGREPDDRHSQEQYAYFYRTDRLRVSGSPILFDDSADDFFQREPYLSRFVLADDHVSFVLINIHTPPRRAVQELQAMEEVFEWAKTHFAEERVFIALGDFNAGCGYASEDELDALPIHGEAYDWVVPHSADTNVADSVCPYDRIVVAAPEGERLVEEWGVDRAFHGQSVSDHWPVWVQLAF